jgi:hypothetical protein
LNQLREEVIQHFFVSVAGFVFQACLIDRSSISPFRINDLRATNTSVAQKPPSIVSLKQVMWCQRVTACSDATGAEIA